MSTGPVLRTGRRGVLRGAAIACFLSMMPCTHAGEAQPAAANPAWEQRVMRISDELRCLVCQNQTLADSQSGLAIDLRNQIREQVERGASDDQIRAYMVERYGDFVLYRPPLKATTWLLWFGPLLLAVIGAGVLNRALRSRREPTAHALTPAQRSRVIELLTDDGEAK